jgi:hypothetical protein
VNARSLIITGAVAVVAAVPATATAKHGGGGSKQVRGTCSGASTSKLKVKPDGRRLEAELEVDQNRNGVRWKVTIRRNGRVAVSTRARTKAPSGSFSLSRRLGNGAGRDRISARATSPSGETCSASLSI